MLLPSNILHRRTSTFIACAFMILSGSPGLAEPGIDGFRELKFGMTEQDVSALPACKSPTSCLYELTDKNRYLELTYSSEKGSHTPEQTEKLEKITIDMGQYTDDWYQQLQLILGASYHLTHDLTDASQRSFLAQEQNELNAGYEDGQVLLKIVRRPFGNVALKVVYQNAALAKAFIQERQASTFSPN